jgi:hypothetical protein
MNKLFVVLSLTLGVHSLWAQTIETSALDTTNEVMDSVATKLRHLRVGAKLGFPNVVGGNLEIVLPIFNNRIAPFVDYSGFTLKTEDDVTSKINYQEIGANVYFGTQGKGLYLAAGAGSLATAFTFENLNLNSGAKGTGSVEETINTLNLKLGIKSKGRLYFRFELGYGMGSIPKEVTLNATGTTSSGQTVSETVTKSLPPLPGVSDNGVLLGNFGIGFSF